jgi:AdoMet-dependent heme synthase
MPSHPPRYPAQRLHHLDALWIQVAGTLCNLECAHCFVSSGPGNASHGMMPRAVVRERVAEALPYGVKEFYLTGGEPFLHPEVIEILGDTLAHGPCTVLTNGTLFTAARLRALRRLSDRVRYALELRVSLDGFTAAEHDRVRGPGSFARALEGLRGCAAHDLLPIVTVTGDGEMASEILQQRYLELLRGIGMARPRIKVLPLFRLGRQVGRAGGYAAAETLADLPAEQFDPDRLQCGRCRAVTSRGVYVCPLLVEEPGGRMGARLSEARGPFTLRHGACFTCHVTGMTCGN